MHIQGSVRGVAFWFPLMARLEKYRGDKYQSGIDAMRLSMPENLSESQRGGGMILSIKKADIKSLILYVSSAPASMAAAVLKLNWCLNVKMVN